MILHTLIDYDVLRVIWWLLLGVLLIGFAVTDGFDLGVGTLLPIVARTDLERRIVINTIGPVWEGNQVWLVLGGLVYSIGVYWFINDEKIRHGHGIWHLFVLGGSLCMVISVVGWVL